MKFGEYLLKKGKIGEADLNAALQLQAQKGVSLGSLAVEEGLLTEHQLGFILDYQREIRGNSSFREVAISKKFWFISQLVGEK